MNAPIGETLGQRIKRLRLAAGYKNRSAFSRFAGIERTMTWRWESDLETPTTASLHKLAVALHVDDIYLLTGRATSAEQIEERASIQLKNLKSAIMRACIARRSISEIQRIVSDA